MWFAYFLAFQLGADPFSAAGNTPNAPGVEIRIIAVLGPHGTDKAQCEQYANSQRPVYAELLKLKDYRLIKYYCALGTVHQPK